MKTVKVSIIGFGSIGQGVARVFLMKKEWFFWPLGPIFRKMGGIPVWRSMEYLQSRKDTV